jgi:hypothetical protein
MLIKGRGGGVLGGRPVFTHPGLNAWLRNFEDLHSRRFTSFSERAPAMNQPVDLPTRVVAVSLRAVLSEAYCASAFCLALSTS